MLQLAGLVLALCPIGMAWAESQAEAKQWLERMVHAAQTLNYEGTFVYVQGQSLETMRVIHGNGAEGERQRMFSLNGPVREVVVADNKVTCLLPKQTVAFNSTYYNRTPFPISLPRELGMLDKNYEFGIVGDDRVAGMKARVIAIQPRDPYRFGYRLWLDHETGMVLRSTLLDESGHILEQLIFTDLRVKPKIDATLLNPPDSERLIIASTDVMRPTSDAVLDSRWTVSDLPAGFRKVMHKYFAGSSSANPTEHILFTDGLATVSVFLEKLDNNSKPLLEGASHIGAMNAYGVVVEDHQAVVVGEVPAITVKKIALSVRRLEKEGVE